MGRLPGKPPLAPRHPEVSWIVRATADQPAQERFLTDNVEMIRPSWFTLLILVCASLPLLASSVGKDWGIEKQSWIDPVTGVRVWEMTANKGDANTLYFHFPNFTRDGRYLLFTSNRTGANQIYRMSIPEGRIVQLTDSPGVSGLVPDHTHPRRIYYHRGLDILALDIEDFSERLVGTPPAGGGLSLSGDGKWLTLSRRIDSKTSEIGLVSTETGQYKTVTRVGFRIGLCLALARGDLRQPGNGFALHKHRLDRPSGPLCPKLLADLAGLAAGTRANSLDLGLDIGTFH